MFHFYSGLFAIHTCLLYQGALLTRIIMETNLEKPDTITLNELADLVRDGWLRINFQDDESVIYEQIMRTNDTSIKYFRKALHMNPPLFVSADTLHDEDGKPIAHIHTNWMQVFGNVSLTNCNFYIIIFETLLEQPMAIPMSSQIDMHFMKQVNDGITQSYELISNVIHGYFKYKRSQYLTCLRRELHSKKKAGSPLPWNRMQGAFVFPIIGLIVGFCGFLGERIYRKQTVVSHKI